jgi:hypothetical protein
MRKLLCIPLLFICYLSFGQVGVNAPGNPAPRYSFNKLFLYRSGLYHSVLDSAEIVALISGGGGMPTDSVLHVLKNGFDISNKSTFRNNLVVYSRSEIDTKVQLKQPRIISALPTQTLTRPLVSDSVNQAFAKLIFRGDSLASAIGTRVLKAGDTMTGMLSMSSTSTGISSYNTVDQTTNYERVRQAWASNTFTIGSEIGGTGTIRNLNIQVNGKGLFLNNGALSGTVNVSNSTSSTNISTLGVSDTRTTASAFAMGASILQTYNQSSTAGYRSLWISPFEQALGSGVHYLIDAGTNSAGAGSGTHTSKFTVDNAGNIVATSLNSAITATTQAAGDNSTKLATTTYADRIGAIAGSFSGVGTATTTFTVTIGVTQANTTYKVNVTPTDLLGAAVFYVNNKTTTTFDVVYLTGLTGTLTFDWSLFK